MNHNPPTHLAYCGFDCSMCPVYIATKTHDMISIEALRAKFSTKDHILTDDELHCHGCKSNLSEIHAFCANCEFRICAMSKKVDSCGQCRQYPCALIDERFPIGCESRRILDEIHCLSH